MKATLAIIFSILVTIPAFGESTENVKLFAIPKIEMPPSTADTYTPKTIKDKKTGLIFYVESDQRHIAAIDSDAKLRWIVDIADSRYTTEKIVIRRVEIKGDVLSIFHNPGISYSTIDIKSGILRYHGTD